MPHTDRGMVFETAPRQFNQLILQIRYFTDTAASKKCFFNRIIRKLCFTSIYNDFSILCLAIRDGGRKCLNPSLIAAPAGTRIVFCKHLMFRNRPFCCHHSLGNRSAMEQDYLVFLITIVIIPIQNSRRLFACQVHGAHGDGGAHVYLAGCHDSPVIQFT